MIGQSRDTMLLLSDGEATEQAQWGDFALGEFPPRRAGLSALCSYREETPHFAARSGLSSYMSTCLAKEDGPWSSYPSTRAIAMNALTRFS